MTPSEEFVSVLCKKSFLPFWSFPSPLGKKNKELCDVLIVCGNEIIIISVKDIKISSHNDQAVQYERWQKKAISGSIDQIYGAERFLKSVDQITLNDQKTKITLVEKKQRNIYRIAIAFGGENRFPLETGNFGSGFVHVFDEESTFTVLSELDTVTDFINYLKAKELFLANKRILVPKEVDFLAMYIDTSLDFDFNPDTVVIDHDLWLDYVKSPEYRKWQKDIRVSYIWDEIVSQLHQIHIVENKTPELRTDLEKATRIITLEPRMNRMELGLTLTDAIQKKVKGRMIKPFNGSGHSYVFMPLSSKNWEQKEKELQLRCLVARYENPGAAKVIGIAMGKSPDNEPIFDIAYFDLPDLSDEIIQKIQAAKQILGYFKDPVISHSKDMRG
jgi:hypothetical protein